ncbi:hypothetical protein ABZ686_21675 [Streptomyces sp. NPDC006992]|uniref:hypothetical protein n=1 Tax=Streptomyces sp. NPDC006992 TaxID=3155601 RepID=UPI0033C510E3
MMGEDGAVVKKRSGVRKARRRLSLVVDIEKYSRRTHPEQVALQNRLDWAMKTTLESAGVDPRRCNRQEKGDGLLLILPSDLPEDEVVPRLLTGLQTVLHDMNRTPGPGGRLRMRMALAQGIVRVAPTGFVGEGVEMASLLEGCPATREALDTAPDHDLAIAVPDDYYQDVLAQDFGGPRAADFRRVTVEVKSADGGTAVAWVLSPRSVRSDTCVPRFTPAALGTPRKRFRSGSAALLAEALALGLDAVDPQPPLPDGTPAAGGSGSEPGGPRVAHPHGESERRPLPDQDELPEPDDVRDLAGVLGQEQDAFGRTDDGGESAEGDGGAPDEGRRLPEWTDDGYGWDAAPDSGFGDGGLGGEGLIDGGLGL